MSILVLGDDQPQTFMHHLESFSREFFWFNGNQKRLSENKLYDKWNQLSAQESTDTKCGITSNDLFERKVDHDFT